MFYSLINNFNLGYAYDIINDHSIGTLEHGKYDVYRLKLIFKNIYCLNVHR